MIRDISVIIYNLRLFCSQPNTGNDDDLGLAGVGGELKTPAKFVDIDALPEKIYFEDLEFVDHPQEFNTRQSRPARNKTPSWFKISPPYIGHRCLTVPEKPAVRHHGHNPFAMPDEEAVDRLRTLLQYEIDHPTADGNTDDCLDRAFSPLAEFFLQVVLDHKDWPVVQFGWYTNMHMTAGMQLFRRRHMENPYPYENGRIAFIPPSLYLTFVTFHANLMQDPEVKLNETLKKLYKGEYSDLDPPGKKWFSEVDILFATLNVKGAHWVALEIDLINSNIKVYDSMPSYTQDDVMAAQVSPFAQVIPYLHMKMAQEESQEEVIPEPYSCARALDMPSDKESCNCGLYTLKFIECVALCINVTGLNEFPLPATRLRFAVDVLNELQLEDVVCPLDLYPRTSGLKRETFNEKAAAWLALPYDKLFNSPQIQSSANK